VTGGYVRKTSTLQEVKDALYSRLAKAELDLSRHRGEHRTEEGMQDRVNQRLAARITALEEAVRKIS
jgi:DNA replication initiation complex subunit (GINS family)